MEDIGRYRILRTRYVFTEGKLSVQYYLDPIKTPLDKVYMGRVVYSSPSVSILEPDLVYYGQLPVELVGRYVWMKCIIKEETIGSTLKRELIEGVIPVSISE